MRSIRTLFTVCILSLFSFTILNGQDMSAATDLYNAGAKALGENDYASALDSFNKALKMLEAITPEDRGEEGANLIKETKAIIPQIHLRYGKTLATSGEIDNAMTELKKAIETAKAYSVAEVGEEATGLIPQLLMASATNNLNAGKEAEAIAGFKKVIEADPKNSDAYLYTGVAQQKLNNEPAAIAAYEKAIELGDTETAPKRLSVIFLTKSANAVKTKNWAEVLANAKKSNEYSESPTGNKLIGLSAVQLKKFDDAIEALEKYLAADPNAKDKNSTLYNLAVAFEGKNNTGKACGYYKQLLSDPTYKQIAEYKVKTTLKCN
jgi:tetratricopeptide (TPR) repeat protein